MTMVWIFIVLMAVSIIFHVFAARKIKKDLEQYASSHGGKVVQGYNVELPCNDFEVRFWESYNAENETYTFDMHANLICTKKLQIASKQLWSWYLGKKTVCDNPAFIQRFHVISSDPQWAKQICRQKIMELCLSFNKGCHLSCRFHRDGAWLRIFCPKNYICEREHAVDFGKKLLGALRYVIGGDCQKVSFDDLMRRYLWLLPIYLLMVGFLIGVVLICAVFVVLFFTSHT